MATLQPTVERRQGTAAPLRRVSWGAIFAGAALATAVLVLLGLLGVAVGATITDPATGDTPSPTAMGVGAGLWWIVSGILALLAGGWAAGRLAGLRRRWEAPLHGLVTWAITTTAMIFLMSTAVGSVVSGAFRLVDTGARFVDRGAVTDRGWRGMHDRGGHRRGDDGAGDRDRRDRRDRGDAAASAPDQAAIGPVDEAEAREAAQAATDAVATAAWLTFGFLILSAVAAALGALGGSPRREVDSRGIMAATRPSPPQHGA